MDHIIPVYVLLVRRLGEVNGGLARPAKRRKTRESRGGSRPVQARPLVEDVAELLRIPVTYQELNDYFASREQVSLFTLRSETFQRIERATERPLICYVTRTHHIPSGLPAYLTALDDSDLTGFADLMQSVEGESVDVFIVSNGGTAEATERIVRLLRQRFRRLRFIVPANAYSAATMMCFSGDEILMGPLGTLGPIDPQINGVPARAIRRAFDWLEARLKEEGPGALTAYLPLISKYDLHILEICKSAEELSKELARSWLSTHMLRCPEEDQRIANVVGFFADYDYHKSHGRSIDREKARELGLKVTNVEDMEGLGELIPSLYNQYELWFDKSPFCKVFENAHGIHWGRHLAAMSVPPPGPPQPSG